jgi:hypothetical protein
MSTSPLSPYRLAPAPHQNDRVYTRLDLDRPRLTIHVAARLTCPRITFTTPTANRTCTTARLMHDQNKVEACRRPNRLYRYKSRGFPAVRTSTPVSVILNTDQSRGVLWICGTLTTTFLQTEHFSSHLRSSLSSYRANELHPNCSQDLSSAVACQGTSELAIA